MPSGTYNGYDWTWYDEYAPEQDEEPERTAHECVFPDTGMRRSWCRHCGNPAEFNMRTGTYRRIDEKSSNTSSEGK